MDVVERLTLEAAQADTMIACEHRQRYEFAAGLCAGRRVLDLGCGSGYGTEILARRAGNVVGVDNDAATIDAARGTLGARHENVSFEPADAIEYLRGPVGSHFDVIVCFECLEHLPDLDSALELLRGLAEHGLQVIASVPNSKLFGERNDFHVTDFGYDEALAAFAAFPRKVMIPQFLAEGSLLCPPAPSEVSVTVSLEDRDEPEYANHFLFCVNFEEAEVGRFHSGQMQLSAAPVFNRWAEDLKHAAWALRRENARLARGHLGKAGSAAASALAATAATVGPDDDLAAALEERCRAAEAQVIELAAALARSEAKARPARAVPAPGPQWSSAGADAPETNGGAAREDDSAREEHSPDAHGAEAVEDPNTWEQRRRRAAEVVIPWIEQTVPLSGLTVLEYGCGNAAVSCAFAERAEKLIGVDIDAGWIDLGREEVRKRGLTNVELELHPIDSILDAVAARRGEIDVFLCYAVLEHLTIAERLAVLRLARDVVKPGGAIVVCEAPNRLIYFDHHTAQMPFFHLLPDELALDYYPRSHRDDFRAAIDTAARGGRDDALEAIVRWGRGVSFHEFELVFGDLSRHVIASSYDPVLFPERPVHADEVILARYLDRWRPDLAPAWSRYWLDVILSPREVSKRPPFLRPWSAETIESSHVGWTRGENLRLRGPEATLMVTLPQPTSKLVVGTVAGTHRLELRARPETSVEPLVAVVDGAPGHAHYTTFALPRASNRIALSTDAASHVVFVGYED